MKLDQRLQKIELILCDVDGVLTDGGITFDNQGIENKTFHVRDGLGVNLWHRAGKRLGLLTARSSHIVQLRAQELGIELVRQGFSEKVSVARQIMDEYHLQPDQVCFIGDDLTDLPVVSSVGLGVAVADAVEEVRKAAHLVTKLAGGQGAVRELVETILKAQGRWQEIIESYRRT